MTQGKHKTKKRSNKFNVAKEVQAFSNPLMDIVEEWMNYFEGLFLDDTISKENKVQLFIQVHRDLLINAYVFGECSKRFEDMLNAMGHSGYFPWVKSDWLEVKRLLLGLYLKGGIHEKGWRS